MCVTVRGDWFWGGGGGGGAKFLESNVVEMQISMFRDSILYCVIGRQGFPGRQDFAGGQGPWRT